MNYISYSIFGNDYKYYEGIDVIVMANHEIFPKFRLAIYHDSSLKNNRHWKWLTKAADAGFLLLRQYEESKALTRSMNWRMLPLWENDCETLFTRDIDSLPLVRDRAMVEEFLQTDAVAHNICDDPRHHWNFIPLMGGCMGFRTKEFISTTGFNSFEEYIRGSGHSDEWFNVYARDEMYLKNKIYPMFASRMCYHLTKDQENCPSAKYNFRSVNFNLVDDVRDIIKHNADFYPIVCAKWWGGKINEARQFYTEHCNQELVKIITNNLE